mmetsp:Transcript_70156/g.214955  ORF Transcript_70156/g.214955 Transcript_70156/m.214955 type:complete len:317 (+) Transcript_70156:37-987(+)
MVSLALTSKVTVFPVSVLMKICMVPPSRGAATSWRALVSSRPRAPPPAPRIMSSLATRCSSTSSQSSSVLFLTWPSVWRTMPRPSAASGSTQCSMSSASASSLGRSRRYMHRHSSQRSTYETRQAPRAGGVAAASAAARTAMTSRRSQGGARGFGVLASIAATRDASSCRCISGSFRTTEVTSARPTLTMAPPLRRWIVEWYHSTWSQPDTTRCSLSTTTRRPDVTTSLLLTVTSRPLQDSRNSPRLPVSKGYGRAAGCAAPARAPKRIVAPPGADADSVFTTSFLRASGTRTSKSVTPASGASGPSRSTKARLFL